MKTEPGLFLKAFLHTSDNEYYRYLKQRYSILNSLIEVREGDKILDAGCGDGAVIKLILDKKIKNTQVIGVDKCTNILNQAKKNFSAYHEKVRFIKTDIIRLPFPNNYFDKTICFHVIEHLKAGELNKALEELTRVTQEELFLGFPNKYSALRIWEIFSQEGIKGITNKIVCFIKRGKPLIIDNPKYSHAPHVYYSAGYIKKILKQFNFQPQIIKKVYFPFKFFDISQKGLSTPFGHSIIIKSVKINKK